MKLVDTPDLKSDGREVIPVRPRYEVPNTMTIILLVLLLLQVKHLIIDWVLQPQWMWSNKHTYGHYGGTAHAAFNGFFTAVVIAPFLGSFWLVFLADTLIHYHIDWAKMNINKIKGWGPNTHAQFWWLTGADQFMHQITYIGILAALA